MTYKSVLPQLFERIAVDGAITPTALRLRVEEEHDRVQQGEPSLDDDMHQYVVERNVWRALYSDEYGNTIPRFTGIKPAPASQLSTIEAELAEPQFPKPAEFIQLETNKTSPQNPPSHVPQFLARQSPSSSALSKTERSSRTESVTSMPSRSPQPGLKSHLRRTGYEQKRQDQIKNAPKSPQKDSKRRPQTDNTFGSHYPESFERRLRNQPNSNAVAFKQNLKQQFDNSRHPLSVPVGYRPSYWDDERGCPFGAVFPVGSNTYTAILGPQAEYLIEINHRLGYDLRNNIGPVRLFFLRSSLGRDNTTPMVWLDVAKGMDPNTPTNIELLHKFQSFLYEYDAKSGELRPIHLAFDVWVERAPGISRQCIENRRQLQYPISGKDNTNRNYSEHVDANRRKERDFQALDQFPENSYPSSEADNNRRREPHFYQERSHEVRTREPRNSNRVQSVR
ncbi:hypothetical protein ONS96_007617 [Cadophora gregata f. sp. sojae]|nr:hypothetical protein ONS96_007617 [Cadophora gregata f. sp. sojae]